MKLLQPEEEVYKKRLSNPATSVKVAAPRLSEDAYKRLTQNKVNNKDTLEQQVANFNQSK